VRLEKHCGAKQDSWDIRPSYLLRQNYNLIIRDAGHLEADCLGLLLKFETGSKAQCAHGRDFTARIDPEPYLLWPERISMPDSPVCHIGICVVE
jgi:hypothetical protein